MPGITFSNKIVCTHIFAPDSICKLKFIYYFYSALCGFTTLTFPLLAFQFSCSRLTNCELQTRARARTYASTMFERKEKNHHFSLDMSRHWCSCHNTLGVCVCVVLCGSVNVILHSPTCNLAASHSISLSINPHTQSKRL